MAKNVFVCTYTNCGKTMSTRTSWMQHRNSHKNTIKIHPDIKCIIPDCSWTGKSVSIRKHIKTKHKNQQHKTLKESVRQARCNSSDHSPLRSNVGDIYILN